MKSLKITATGLAALSGLFLASCQPDPVYVPVYVPVENKTPAPKKVTYTPKPKPKPVETAEGFRAVEKPTTYSN
jgi:hypothetical protein